METSGTMKTSSKYRGNPFASENGFFVFTHRLSNKSSYIVKYKSLLANIRSSNRYAESDARHQSLNGAISQLKNIEIMKNKKSTAKAEAQDNSVSSNPSMDLSVEDGLLINHTILKRLATKECDVPEIFELVDLYKKVQKQLSEIL